MKRYLLILTLALTALVAAAREVKTVVFTTDPQMHCASCENKIKGNLRFERGVKAIETCVDSQTVTVRYDAQKTSPEKLIAALAKIGYTAKVVKPCPAEQGEEATKSEEKE